VEEYPEVSPHEITDLYH